MMLTVSVLMANFNNEAYVGDAIGSVQRQTYKHWELLIGDDASKDGSLGVINRLARSDKRIRVFRHGKNKGYIANLKYLITKAKGEILAIVDSDDEITADALAKVVSEFEKNRDLGFVYSQFMYCDNSLKPLQKGYCRQLKKGETNLRENVVSHLKAFRKDVYSKTSGFDLSMEYCEDKDLILKLEEVTNMKFIDKVLYLRRYRKDSHNHDPVKASTGRFNYTRASWSAFIRRKNRSQINITRLEMGNRLVSQIIESIRRLELGQVVILMKMLFKII